MSVCMKKGTVNTPLAHPIIEDAVAYYLPNGKGVRTKKGSSIQEEIRPKQASPPQWDTYHPFLRECGCPSREDPPPHVDNFSRPKH